MFTCGLSALQHSFTRITASKRRTKRRRDMQVKRDEGVSNHVPLKTSSVQGKSKGERPMDPACDAWRGVLYVPAYGSGVFQHMWKIDPRGVDMPPQTKEKFQKFTDLIKEFVVTYAVEPYIGHPLFTHEVDGKVTSFESITNIVEQHFALWNSVCSIRADEKYISI